MKKLETIHIQLTTGEEILIDKEDLLRTLLFNWYPMYNKNTIVPVSSFNTEGKKKTFRLANYILRKDISTRVIHKNKNHLDCRKENLIVNNRLSNRSGSKYKKSRGKVDYIGVYYYENCNLKYNSSISKLPHRINLGYYETPEEAAYAYNIASIFLNNSSAGINNIPNFREIDFVDVKKEVEKKLNDFSFLFYKGKKIKSQEYELDFENIPIRKAIQNIKKELKTKRYRNINYLLKYWLKFQKYKLEFNLLSYREETIINSLNDLLDFDWKIGYENSNPCYYQVNKILKRYKELENKEDFVFKSKEYQFIKYRRKKYNSNNLSKEDILFMEKLNDKILIDWKLSNRLKK